MNSTRPDPKRPRLTPVSLATEVGRWRLRHRGGAEAELSLGEGPVLSLGQAAQDWHPGCRAEAMAWFRAHLGPEAPAGPLILRTIAGPQGGRLLRFEVEPLAAARSLVLGVEGVFVDFAEQLAPLRRALGFIDHPHIGTWGLDLVSGALDVDPAWARLLGHTPESLGTFGHADWVAMTHPDDVQGFEAPEIHAALVRGEVIQHCTRTRHRDGHWVWILTCCRGAAWDGQGGLTRLIGYDIDVTEHRVLLAATEHQRVVMQRVLEILPTGQLVLDDDQVITYLNPQAADLLDAPPEQLIGCRLFDVLPLEDGAEALRTCLRQGQALRDLPLTLRVSAEHGLEEAVRGQMGGGSKAKPGRDLRRHLSAHLTRVPVIGKSFLSLTDVSAQVAARRDLEQAVEQARFIATHDLMTGLPDRYDFLHRLQDTLAASERAPRSVAVMLIDLDNFKMINDGLGHEKGDQLIKAAAQRLERAVPARARLARFGGDEFVVMVPDCPAAEAALVAEDLRERFAEPLAFSLRHSLMSCSIGLSLFPQDARSADELMRCADLAMYEAKAQGRGQIQRYTPELRARNERRNAVVLAVQRALSDGGFHIVLQPKFDLGQLARPIGAEVLLRLTDPVLGVISPGEFIPIAEAQGLIPAVDREVVRLVQRLRQEGFDLSLSINLSALTLASASFGDLLDSLPRLIGQGGVMVEVTETSFMGNLGAVRDTLHLLRRSGVGVAVDDFGIGHSSLAYLHSLPVQELKIDRSFVASLGAADQPAHGIVRAILAMARALDLATVAEGIETAEQAQWLIDHGCQMAQGFLLGRPVDPMEFRRIYLEPDARAEAREGAR